MVTMSDIKAEVRELFARTEFFKDNGLTIQMEFSPEALRELLTGRLDRLEIVGDDAYQDREDDPALLYLYVGVA